MTWRHLRSKRGAYTDVSTYTPTLSALYWRRRCRYVSCKRMNATSETKVPLLETNKFRQSLARTMTMTRNYTIGTTSQTLYNTCDKQWIFTDNAHARSFIAAWGRQKYTTSYLCNSHPLDWSKVLKVFIAEGASPIWWYNYGICRYQPTTPIRRTRTFDPKRVGDSSQNRPVFVVQEPRQSAHDIQALLHIFLSAACLKHSTRLPLMWTRPKIWIYLLRLYRLVLTDQF